ncbi:MAG: AAA family ATPase [Candidatus Hydrogenedentes bacterium]|nr:AAA family ATPase [Candidatus Hydrogenedentota bacterium]
MKARDNPFATARLHRLAYRPEGWTWDGLFERLHALDCRAAVVGPKGSGKTALLDELAHRLSAGGRRAAAIRIDGEDAFQKRLDARLTELAPFSTDDVVLLDGADRLGPWAWRRLVRRTADAGGLVITSHRPGRLPTLVECTASPELLDALLRRIEPDNADQMRDAAHALFRQHSGNLRDVFRGLYDMCAARQDSMTPHST